MKDCSCCKHCYRECYEDSALACELFGEDVPDWAIANDGCLLKPQEVDKILKISNQIRLVGTGKTLDEYGYPKWTDEDKKHNQKVNKEYDDYIEVVKQRCNKRRENVKEKDDGGW